MKKIYNISIQSSLADNEVLKERIRNIGDSYGYFPGSWLVVSEETAEQIYDKIAKDEYESISILIIEVNPHRYFGRMNKALWAWMDNLNI